MTRQSSLKSKNNSYFIIILIAILAIGVFFARWIVVQADREMRTNLLQQTRLVAQTLNIRFITNLTATNADLNDPGYKRLKEQLMSVRLANPQCRFIYLMGQNSRHKVFFYVDSEPVTSNDYSPPGQLYDEVSEGTYRVFDTRIAAVDGPATDRWGVWVSPLVPIIDSHTDNVAAVLGMDINARMWSWYILAKVALPIGLMLVLMIGVITIFTVSRRVAASPKPVRHHLMPSITIMMILLMAGTGIILWQQNQQYMSREIAADIYDVSNNLETVINQQVSVLAAILQPVIFDADVQKDMREGNSQHLWNTWLPVFQSLSQNNHLSHFDFIDKNKNNISQVGKPDKNNSNIDNFTATEAEITGRISSGFELGPAGVLTLKVVQPVFEGTTLVGYIELDKEIKDVLQTLQTRSGIQLVVTIHKQYLEQHSWEEGMHRLGREASWNSMAHNVVIYSPLGKLPDAFLSWVDEHQHNETDREINADGMDWRVSAIPLYDTSKREIGDLLIMNDITENKSAFASIMTLGGVSVIVILSIFLSFIYILLSRTDAGILAQQLEIQESEQSYHNQFANNSSIMLLINQADGKIINANDAALNFYGYSRKLLLELNISDIDTSSVSEIQQYLASVPQGQGKLFQFQHRLANGSIRDVEASTSIIQFGGHAVLHFIVQDITERNLAAKEKDKLQAQLNQAQKMESVGRLAGGVAHDFNNMLSVIIGNTEMLMEKIDKAHPFYAFLTEILGAAERSGNLTRQLLAFARKQTVSPKVLDLNDIVPGILNMLERLIGEDINLTWLPGEELWPVKVDSSQIDQILANLCVNARDAIAGIGKITIETTNKILDINYCANHVGLNPGEYVALSVSDNGCGMDKEIMSHLFEPFFTTKETGSGTGLGLATVYGVVKQNNGYISAYSEVGQGTTFTIFLPACAGSAKEILSESTVQPILYGEGTILIAEDELTILLMTTKMLQRLGYKVLAASTPEEAVKLAEEYPGEINLLMTDVIMPEMNGKDLSLRILEMHPKIKCLFMSGYTADVIALHGVLNEGVHFLQKPFSLNELTIKIREAFGKE